MLCPICNKESKQFLGHLKRSKDLQHSNFLFSQIQLVVDLFHNINFHKDVNYIDFGLYLNYDNCLNIWRENFSQEERQERSTNINAHKVSLALSGVSKSDEHKKALSEAHKGQKAWNKGLNAQNNHTMARITRRRNKTMSTVLKRKYKNGEMVAWRKGKNKETDERIKVASEQTSKTMSGRPQGNSWGISGVRKDIGHHAASTYEANVYRILQYHNASYKKEFDIVKPIIMSDDSLRHYRIDIQDVEGIFGIKGAYIEVKGFFKPVDRLKVKLFREQYPNETLLMLGYGDKRKEHFWLPDVNYKELTEKYKPLIPLWEDKKQNLKTHPHLYT